MNTSTPQMRSTPLVAALLPYARRRWKGLLGVFAATVLMTAINVLKPWPMKFIVDNALLGQRFPESAQYFAQWLPRADSPAGVLWWGVAATVVLFLVGWIARLASAVAHVAFGQRMVYDLASDLFAHLQRLSLRFHHRKAIGDSIRRVTGDCGCVSAIIKDALLPVISSIFALAVMVVIMWRLDPVLTLLAIAVMPGLALTLRFFAQPMMDRSYRQQEAEGRIYTDVEQTFSSIPAVQAFNRAELHDRRFRQNTSNAVAATLSATNLQLQFKLLVGLFTALGTAAIIWVGARHAMSDTLSVGTILVFLAYLRSLYGPIEALMYSSFSVQGAAGSARRVVEILQAEREIDDRLGAIALPRVRGHVVFEQVSFAYESPRDVLRDVSLEVLPGQTVAVVGATGAGKSTLAGLMLRFNDPKSGRVLLDGHDLRDVRLASLRNQVALVLQDSFLFPVSIAENIAYGRPDAAQEQIIAAARAANAHDFIMRLPQGYDTPVGERGATLSGGERQRIAIARALLRDAPVLILDEPTSNLDAETEQQILAALRQLMAGRTTLVIAHRLSTIRHADLIVVLEHGRIVERGTHDELLARRGLYERLYRAAQNNVANKGTTA